MKNFLESLLSRKLLLAIAGLCVLAANRQWTQFATVLVGYCGLNVLQKASTGE